MVEDYWKNSKNFATVGVVGGGSWGTVLAQLVAPQCREVRLFVRNESVLKSINSTRTNLDYFGDLPEFLLSEKIHATNDLTKFFEGGLPVILWALPSHATREESRKFSPALQGDELIIHATKGIELSSLKRMSEVLYEELPCRRIGVLSGPNLAGELARGEPAAAVIASRFSEVCAAGQALLTSDRFRIYRGSDVIGVEWAGTLKNILAIAAGALDALQLGWNARAMLLTRGLAEIVRFGVAMGAEESTFLGLSGMGDLLATCSSPLSRNYQVGFRLAKEEPLESILQDLRRTAEGVSTTRAVRVYAKTRGIEMPITEGVYRLLEGGSTAKEVLAVLMKRNFASDFRERPLSP